MPAKELLEHEKTIYYERITFILEMPHIHTYINNQKLNLTVGAVRSYSETVRRLHHQPGTVCSFSWKDEVVSTFE
jgi:hypothetical protein